MSLSGFPIWLGPSWAKPKDPPSFIVAEWDTKLFKDAESYEIKSHIKKGDVFMPESWGRVVDGYEMVDVVGGGAIQRDFFRFWIPSDFPKRNLSVIDLDDKGQQHWKTHHKSRAPRREPWIHVSIDAVPNTIVAGGGHDQPGDHVSPAGANAAEPAEPPLAHRGAGRGRGGRGRARGPRTKNKWNPLPIGFDSEEHQFHAGCPSCWVRYGGNRQRWAPVIPEESAMEPFTVGYTERKCCFSGCQAGLRFLQPLPAEVDLLRQIDVPPWSVFQTNNDHLEEHATWFLSPTECKEKTLDEINLHEETTYQTLSEEQKALWPSRKALKLPVSLSTRISAQTQEPLRRSDRMYDALVRDSKGGAATGSPSQAAASSILEGEDRETWKRRVKYARAKGPAGSGSGRIRLSGDVMELWHGYRMRPTHLEIHRPWAYLFRFAQDTDSVEHFYAWTTHSMLQAVWAQRLEDAISSEQGLARFSWISLRPLFMVCQLAIHVPKCMRNHVMKKGHASSRPANMFNCLHSDSQDVLYVVGIFARFYIMSGIDDIGYPVLAIHVRSSIPLAPTKAGSSDICNSGEILTPLMLPLLVVELPGSSLVGTGQWNGPKPYWAIVPLCRW